MIGAIIAAPGRVLRTFSSRNMPEFGHLAIDDRRRGGGDGGVDLEPDVGLEDCLGGVAGRVGGEDDPLHPPRPGGDADRDGRDQEQHAQQEFAPSLESLPALIGILRLWNVHPDI